MLYSRCWVKLQGDLIYYCEQGLRYRDSLTYTDFTLVLDAIRNVQILVYADDIYIRSLSDDRSIYLFGLGSKKNVSCSGQNEDYMHNIVQPSRYVHTSLTKLMFSKY